MDWFFDFFDYWIGDLEPDETIHIGNIIRDLVENLEFTYDQFEKEILSSLEVIFTLDEHVPSILFTSIVFVGTLSIAKMIVGR